MNNVHMHCIMLWGYVFSYLEDFYFNFNFNKVKPEKIIGSYDSINTPHPNSLILQKEVMMSYREEKESYCLEIFLTQKHNIVIGCFPYNKYNPSHDFSVIKLNGSTNKNELLQTIKDKITTMTGYV